VHRNEKGQRLDLNRCPALIPFLLDDSKEKVAMKAVQLGLTELVLVSVYSKALRGWFIIYSFPVIELKNSMVANRVDKSINQVDFYRKCVSESPTGDADSRGLKHFGMGIIKFVGTNSKTAFVGEAADMVVNDEFDESNQENVKKAPDRLDASPHKYHWRFGNPSHSKYGIHAEFLKSDQKEWHLTCQHCGEEQALEWFNNVVEKTGEHEYRLYDKDWKPGCDRDIKIVCRKCKGDLNRLSNGRWIKQNPSSQISGYHLSQLFSPTITIEKLWNKFQVGQIDPTELQLFWNSGLGLPYEAVGTNVTVSLLEAKAMRDYLMPSSGEGCTMGVDVGKKLNVRISAYDEENPDTRKAAYIGSVNDFEDLDTLILSYGVDFCVIDSRPEARKARELQERFPGIVWLCDYATNEKLDFWTVDDTDMTIRADRTEACDGMVSMILTGHDHIPKDFKYLDGGEYITQMEAPKRKIVQEYRADGSPKPPRYVWAETAKDHHFHAGVYDYLAYRLRKLVGKRVCRIHMRNE
jgi:hypothetical protein